MEMWSAEYKIGQGEPGRVKVRTGEKENQSLQYQDTVQAQYMNEKKAAKRHCCTWKKSYRQWKRQMSFRSLTSINQGRAEKKDVKWEAKKWVEKDARKDIWQSVQVADVIKCDSP